MSASWRIPPYKEPLVDAATHGRPTRAWQRFFQTLVEHLVDLGTGVTGILDLSNLPDQPASTVLGRRSTSAGPPEYLTLGAGLTITNRVLSVDPQTAAYYEPLTNGIVPAPELIFAQGDVVMVWKAL